jgi:hypothetical protein
VREYGVEVGDRIIVSCREDLVNMLSISNQEFEKVDTCQHPRMS